MIPKMVPTRMLTSRHTGTLVGVLIIALLQEGILAMGFQINYQYIITGIIVLVVVYADLRSRRRRN